MLAWPLPLCAESAWDTFDPSAISCEQFFAEPKEDDEDEEEDDDDEDDEEDDDDELVVDPPELEEAAEVVAELEDLLLPPQPAAATASTTIGTMAKMRLMLELPLSALGMNLLGRVAVF